MFDERIESNIWYFHGNTEEAREEERARDMEEEERARMFVMQEMKEEVGTRTTSQANMRCLAK